MIAGDILAAEFPKSCIEIANIDHVAGGVADFDPIPDPIWLPDQDVNPGNETFHRRLNSEAEDNGANSERGDCRIPVHENCRERDEKNK